MRESLSKFRKLGLLKALLFSLCTTVMVTVFIIKDHKEQSLSGGTMM
jgi:hypothetical protein